MTNRYVERQSKIFKKFLEWSEMNQHYVNSYLQLIQFWILSNKKQYTRVLHKVYRLLRRKDKSFRKYLEGCYSSKKLNASVLDVVIK